MLELGWLRQALLGPVLLLALGNGLVRAAQHPDGQWAVPLVLAGLLLGAHRQRGDLRFLATAAPGFQRWLAVEYALLATPVTLALLAFGDVGAAALTLVLAPLVAWAGAAKDASPTLRHSRSLFRSEAFEWVSGLRIGLVGPLWLALLAGAAWQHHSPLGPVLALAGWLLPVLACYGVPEPATMLVLAGKDGGAFLRRRLLLGLGYAGLSAAPLLWVLGSGPAGAGAAVGVGLAWLVLVGLLILTKYAFYPNALQIRFTQAAVVAVAVTMPGNPVYPALLAVAIGGLLWQSRRRLQLYFAAGSANPNS
jgi:hypothetical protein